MKKNLWLTIIFLSFIFCNRIYAGGGGGGLPPNPTSLSCGTPVTINLDANGFAGSNPTSGDGGCNPCCYSGADLDGDGLQDVPFSVENSEWFQFCNTTSSAMTVSINADEVGSGSTCNIQGAVWVGSTLSATTLDCGNAGYQYFDSNVGGAADGWTFSNVTVPAGQCAYFMVDGYGGASCSSVTMSVICPCTPPTITASASPSTICQGASSTLTASCSSGCTGITYSWSPSATLSSSTGASVVATPTVTTTYTVTATANSCTSTFPVTVTVKPLPVVNATNQTICSGATLNVGLTSTPTGATFSWIAASNTNVTGESTTAQSGNTINNTLTNTSTTNQTVTYSITPTLNGCVGTPKVITVLVGVIPVMTSITSATICSGQTLAIPLTSNISSTYSWLASNNANTTGESTTAQTGSTINNTIISTATSTTIVNYTVTPTATTSPNCPGLPETISVSILPVATLTVNPVTICSGSSANLTANVSIAGGTYVWNSGGMTTQNVSVSPTTTTTYSVSYSLNSCAPVTKTVVVTVITTPTVTVSSTTICNGQSATLTASTSAGGGTFLWSPGGQTSSSISVSPVGTTTYSVTYTISGCIANSTGVVSVNPIPIISVSPQTICPGLSATLVATGGTTYSWSTGVTNSSITVSPISTTNYTVTGTTLGCSGSAVTSVTVGSAITILVNSPSICLGQTATITATGATAYNWSTGATTSSISVSPVSTTNYTVTGTMSGCSGTSIAVVTINTVPTVTVSSATICNGQAATLTAGGASSYVWSVGAASTGTNTASVSPSSTTSYTVTGSNGGCSATATANVTVNSIPNVTVNNVTICSGEIASFSASGASTYTWSTGTTVTGVNTANALPSSSASYTVTGTSLGCSATATATATVNTSPIVTISNVTICNGQTANLSANGASNYTWSAGILSGGGNIATANPSTTTTYSVTGTTSGCSSTVTFTVVVNPVPAVTATDATICLGQLATLTASGANSYTWSSGTTSTGVNTVSVSPASSTSFTVIGNSLGCTSVAVSNVTVNSFPVINITDVTICSGDIANITATGATTFSWSTGITNLGGGNATATPSSTATYSVTGLSNGCSTTATFDIVVNSIPTINVNNATICGGTSTTLTANGAASYSWSAGALPTGLNTALVTPASTETFTVIGTTNGCSNQSTSTVIVNLAPLLSVNPITICSGITGTLTATGASAYLWSTGATTSSVFVNPSSTTSYTVTGNNLGCTTNSVVSVTVGTAISVIVNPATICAGQSTALTAAGASSYLWSTGETTSSISVNPITTTSYSVTGNTGSCSGSNVVQVTVNSLPVVLVNNATICNGQIATLTANGATTYVWSVGATPTGTNTATANPSLTTSYTVTGTTNGCSSDAVSTVAVNPIPTVSVNNATICVGQTAVLTANGANSYTWSAGTLVTGVNTADVTPASNTSYTVTGTTNGCSADAIAAVTVNAIPLVSVTDATICEGNTATLTANGAAGYTWSTGATSSGINSANVAPIVNTTYTVTGTTNACSASAVSNVTVNPLPILTVNSPTICTGNTANLTANGAATYVWNAGITSTGVNTGSVSPASTTTYTVSGTSVGCSASTQFTVTVNAPDNSSFNYPSATICQTGGNVSANIAGLSGGVFTANSSGLIFLNTSTGLIDVANSTVNSYTITYTTNGSCPTSSSFNVTITTIPIAAFSYAGPYCQNQNNPTPTFASLGSAGLFTATPAGLSFVSSTTGQIDLINSTAGTYTVTNTIAASGACPAAIASYTVTINAMPVVSANSATICNGQSTSITANGANSYTWSSGLTATGISTASANPTTIGVNNYTVTGTSNGCSSNALFSIVVNDIPSISVNNATICNGQSATLTGTPNLAAGTYSWNSGETTQSITVSPSSNTTYTVTYTLNGCSNTGSGTVQVNPIPTVTVNDATVCAGTSATLTATPDLVGGTYLWQPSGTTNQSINVSPASTTSYTVTYTLAGCSVTGSGNVNANPIPAVAVSSTTICNGQNATLSATPNPAGGTYNWDNGQTTQNINVSPSSTTSYTVTYSLNGCSNNDIAQVTVNPIPTVTISPNPAVICVGQNITLTANPSSVGGTYNWLPGNVQSPTIIVSPNISTTYTVVYALQGCSNSATNAVTVISLPSITLSNATICEGETATIGAVGNPLGGTYLWQPSGATTQSITDNPSSTTTYTVTYTMACSNSATASIQVHALPTIGISIPDDTVTIANATINFTNTTSGAVAYVWNFGDNASSNNTSTAVNPSHTYTEEGIYCVELIATNSIGCADTTTLCLLVTPEFAFYIPNAFSPNGDNVNDTFYGKGVNIAKFEMSIFDRWGMLLFSSDDINKHWDGTYKSVMSQQDVYVYVVKLKDNKGEIHNYKGEVTLVR
jgi:gliding motility-associated-like protein